MRMQYCQQRFARTTLALAISAALSAPAMALDLTWLTNPALQGRVTFDGFLGNADDVIIPGINTLGAASQFASTAGYGFVQGTHSASGLTILGPQDRVVFGTNVFNSVDLSGEGNIFFPPHFNEPGTFNIPFTQHLDLNSPHSSTINHDQSYTNSVVLDDTLTGGRIEYTGVGHYLLANQNAATLYSGDELTHFNFVRPLLPSNFAGVAHEIQTFKVLDGPFAGNTGVSTLTFFSTDFNQTMPEDPPAALGAPWVTTGYAALTTGNAGQIGSPNNPGIDGTAVLSGGDTATLDSLNVGGVGAGAVTLQGAGTSLSLTSQSVVMLRVLGKGQLTIEDGARISASGRFITPPTSNLHVGGAGSELLLNKRGSFGALAVMNGTASIDSGAHVIVDGGSSGLSALVVAKAAVDGGLLSIDGSGSLLRIQGGVGPGATGLGISNGATIEVTNGASIQIEKIVVQGFRGLDIATDPAVVAAGVPLVGPSRLLIDGANSAVDAGSLLTVSIEVFGAQASALLDSGRAGELTVRNGGLALADKILIGSSGVVKGNGGTLQGSVENRGTIAPGESPGTLNIVGDLTQTTIGKLVIEIGGNTPGLFDVLNVSGKFTMGGTLEIDFLNGFTPGPNDTFSFLNAGSFDGAFANFILPTLGNGQTLQLNFGPHGISAGAVPLPAAVWLLGSAFGALGFARRRAA